MEYWTMSVKMKEEVKRWTVKRKSALVLEIIQGKTTVTKRAALSIFRPLKLRIASTTPRAGWRTPCVPIRWTCASSTRSKSKNCRKPTLKRCWNCVSEKTAVPVGEGREVIETIQNASRVIGDWIGFYDNRHPHQALNMRTPVATFKLAA